MTDHARARPTTVQESADAYLAALPGSGAEPARAALALAVEALGPDRALADIGVDQVHGVLTELEQRRVWTVDDWGTVDAWLAWSRQLSTEESSRARSGHKPGLGGYREIRWGRSGSARPGDHPH